MDAVRSLPRRFSEARLDLELLREPLSQSRWQRGLEQIVQIDIARPPRRSSERFQLFPGADDNRIEVLGVDAPRRQLVLFVQESRRAFTTTISRAQPVPKGVRVVGETKTSRTIEQFTEPEKRHFLCGMDEQHYFIAQLPYGVSSVHGARDALRAPEVPPSLHVRGSQIIRQGEWFFMPASARDRAAIEVALRARKVQRDIGIAQAARLNRAGRPHVADEVVVTTEGSEVRIYVRGDVRHPDHRTVTLREFHRTVPNRERFTQPAGVYWVD
ncbi:MAG: hypothetical protein HOW73_45555 [Polyangiaceae bacterium]|nr:hypothetical protein [Polyangiaceae bacterium]